MTVLEDLSKLLHLMLVFNQRFFFFSDIHKATEEIANVNNTKIEKIRLHLIEVGSALHKRGYHLQLMKIWFFCVGDMGLVCFKTNSMLPRPLKMHHKLSRLSYL